MKTYTIIAGVNGAGKSSLTGVLRTEITNLGKIIDVDKIIAKYNGNMIEGGKKSIELIDDCLDKEICFTQETTLSGHRVFNTVKKGGHNIPDLDVIRRFEKRFEDLTMILPYCDEATFYDNENGFVAVAEYKNGEIMQIGSSRPQWLKELMEYVI